MSNIDNAVHGDETVDAVNRHMDMFEKWARERNFYAPNGATYDGQYFKLMEEKGELAGGIARNSVERIKDAIGDILCVLAVLRGFTPRDKWQVYHTVQNIDIASVHSMHNPVAAYNVLHDMLGFTMYNLMCVSFDGVASALSVLANQYNLTLPECVAHVWGEIKDRKGVMYNGVFIKDSDPRYAELADLGEVPCIDEGCEHHGTAHYCVSTHPIEATQPASSMPQQAMFADPCEADVGTSTVAIDDTPPDWNC